MSDDALERAVRAQERTAAVYEEARISWQTERRERIATAALQGLLANPSQDTFPPDTARIAIKYADALIAELDKEDGQ